MISRDRLTALLALAVVSVGLLGAATICPTKQGAVQLEAESAGFEALSYALFSPGGTNTPTLDPIHDADHGVTKLK